MYHVLDAAANCVPYGAPLSHSHYLYTALNPPSSSDCVFEPVDNG